MHTSTRLTAADFQYRRHTPTGTVKTDFTTFFPDYNEQDRVGIVSLTLEDGILHTGVALLAITTSFYDIMRDRSDSFFDYPMHFALIGACEDGVLTRQGRQKLEREAVGAAWGWLDVWPNSNWIMSPDSATGMMDSVFRNQINRLFWPQNLTSHGDETPLPAYIRQLLAGRLKSVYYYDTTDPTIEIHASERGVKIIQESIERLPNGGSDVRVVSLRESLSVPYVQQYRQVEVKDFLDTMQPCFER